MPPILALLLCTAFVLGLLWIDHQRTSDLSTVVWLPTLWFLIAASRPLSLWFAGLGMAGESASVEDGSPVDRLVLSCLIALAFVVLSRRRFNWSQALTENRWLVVLFAYMLVSILWSDFPFVSFKRWVKTAGTVLMAFVVLTEVSPLAALHGILRRTAYILIPFSITLIKYYPNLGVQYGRWSGGTSWAGVTMGKNGLGPLCMVSVLILIWGLVRRREGKEPYRVPYQTTADLLVLGIAFLLMRGPGGAYSATSIVVLALGLTTFFLLRRLNAAHKRLGFLAGIIVAGAGLLFLMATVVFETSLPGLIAPLLGRDSTMTGRTDLIWSKLIPLSLENPVLGVGYGAFWIRPVDFEFTMPINQAHNGYLDVFIELGGVGLVLIAILATSFFGKAREEFRSDPDWASLRIAFLLIVLVHNCTETSFLRSTILLWNLFVFFMVIHPDRQPEVADAFADSTEASASPAPPLAPVHA